MSVRMRHTKGHTKNRRSHHALSEPRLATCKDCGSSHMRHRMCANCGKYRGRLVVDMKAQEVKRAKRIADKKAALGQEVKSEKKGKKEDEEKSTEGPLSAKELSQK